MFCTINETWLKQGHKAVLEDIKLRGYGELKIRKEE